jgi:hypothetical protein
MSTSTLIRPVETHPEIHVIQTRRHTWVCVQPHCDGVHHYWRRSL